jgi:LEA14-like dessication related protein
VRSFTFLILFLVFLAGCKKPEAPEFRTISDLEIILTGLDKAQLKGNALFYNPNKSSIKIRDVEIDVLLDETKVAGIDKSYDITAEGMSDFSIPLEILVDLEDLQMNTIGAVLDLFTRRERQLRYLGKVKVKAYGVPFSVPVDYSETLQLSL